MNNLLRKVVVILATVASAFSASAQDYTLNGMAEMDKDLVIIPQSLNNQAFVDWKKTLPYEEQDEIDQAIIDMTYMGVNERSLVMEEMMKAYPDLRSSLGPKSPDPSYVTQY